MGFDRPAVEAAADSYSPETPLTGDLAVILHGCIWNLIGYPHGKDAVWSKWLSVTPQELERIFRQWCAQSSA